MQQSQAVFAKEQMGTHVSAHRWCPFEGDDLEAGLLCFFNGFLVHITQSHLILWNLDLEFERCFQVRLVEAGECSPRI